MFHNTRWLPAVNNLKTLIHFSLEMTMNDPHITDLVFHKSLSITLMVENEINKHRAGALLQVFCHHLQTKYSPKKKQKILLIHE